MNGCCAPLRLRYGRVEESGGSRRWIRSRLPCGGLRHRAATGRTCTGQGGCRRVADCARSVPAPRHRAVAGPAERFVQDGRCKAAVIGSLHGAGLQPAHGGGRHAATRSHCCDQGSGTHQEAQLDRTRQADSGPPGPDELVASMLGDAVDRGVREESVREVLQVESTILPGYSTLVCDSPVFASPDCAADLNETLANRLVSQPDLMADPGTKFVPMFIGIRVDGGHTERAV